MTGDPRLPDGPLVAFYGDDYTGSSAAMEALTFAGLPTMLFLEPPTPERLAAAGAIPRHRHCRRRALAGITAWMDRHLPAGVRHARRHRRTDRALQGLLDLRFRAAYRLDRTGDRSRGAACSAATGIRCWSDRRRWAAIRRSAICSPAVHGIGHRLDRHPTMSRHPVTPMDESDLGRHLARQTARKIGLVDFVTMANGGADRALAQRARRWRRDHLARRARPGIADRSRPPDLDASRTSGCSPSARRASSRRWWPIGNRRA